MISPLVRLLSLGLEPNDRDAALGDLEESGASSTRALIDIVGLLARHRWPWFALAAVALPLGILLRIASADASDGNAVTLWFYTNNWDWELVRDIAFRQDFAVNATQVSFSLLFLACCSWIAGLTLRTANPAIALTVVAGALFLDPLPHQFPPVDAVVFDGAFYGVLFPLLVRTLLVLVPFRLGMLTGTKSATLRAAALVTLCIVVVVLWTPAQSLVSILKFAACWPALYWIINQRTAKEVASS